MKEKVEKRLSGQEYVPDMPYDVVEIHTVSYQLDGDALIAESELLGALKDSQYWPNQQFSGRSECFIGDEIENIVIEYMDRDSEGRNNKPPSFLKYKLASARVKRQFSDPIERHKAVLSKCSEL